MFELPETFLIGCCEFSDDGQRPCGSTEGRPLIVETNLTSQGLIHDELWRIRSVMSQEEKEELSSLKKWQHLRHVPVMEALGRRLAGSS